MEDQMLGMDHTVATDLNTVMDTIEGRIFVYRMILSIIMILGMAIITTMASPTTNLITGNMDTRS